MTRDLADPPTFLESSNTGPLQRKGKEKRIRSCCLRGMNVQRESYRENLSPLVYCSLPGPILILTSQKSWGAMMDDSRPCVEGDEKSMMKGIHIFTWLIEEKHCLGQELTCPVEHVSVAIHRSNRSRTSNAHTHTGVRG